MKKTNETDRREKERKRSGGSAKKTMLLLGGAALALIALAAVLLIVLFSGLSEPKPQNQALEDYLAEHWTVFRLRSWDAETGTLELDYPLRFSYAQMEKYGASVEELRELPAGNKDTVEALRAAARETAGAVVQAVTVYGLTTDGQVAYTLFPDGSVEACWEKTAENES